MSQVKNNLSFVKGRKPGYYDHKKCSMVSCYVSWRSLERVHIYVWNITSVARTWCIGKESRLMLPLATIGLCCEGVWLFLVVSLTSALQVAFYLSNHMPLVRDLHLQITLVRTLWFGWWHRLSLSTSKRL
jgi:hypothetical protein